MPRELFGLPIDQTQSDDPSRIAELVQRILENKPQALLLSAGGNDIAGDEFFFLNHNAQLGLASVNQDLLDGVVNNTFKTAYVCLINTARAAARQAHITMPISHTARARTIRGLMVAGLFPSLVGGSGRGSIKRLITRIIHITTSPT